MARIKKSKAIVHSIKFTSRTSLKIGDTFYTMEACEERILPEGLTETEIASERSLLWDAVNVEVDKQAEDVWKEHNKKKKGLH